MLFKESYLYFLNVIYFIFINIFGVNLKNKNHHTLKLFLFAVRNGKNLKEYFFFSSLLILKDFHGFTFSGDLEVNC